MDDRENRAAALVRLAAVPEQGENGRGRPAAAERSMTGKGSFAGLCGDVSQREQGETGECHGSDGTNC